MKRTLAVNRQLKGTAHGRVANALKSGKLVRPKKCQDCGVGGKIVAHHEDYARALHVEWVCIPCHFKRHHPGMAMGLGTLNVKVPIAIKEALVADLATRRITVTEFITDAVTAYLRRNQKVKSHA